MPSTRSATGIPYGARSPLGQKSLEKSFPPGSTVILRKLNGNLERPVLADSVEKLIGQAARLSQKCDFFRF